MGLNKDICFKCCMVLKVSAAPGILSVGANEVRAECARQFEKDWNDGFVQCLGVGNLNLRDSPIQTGLTVGAQGVYVDTDIKVDGPVPGFCLEKRGQFGERLWADYIKAIEDNGEMKDGEVAADEERIQRRNADDRDKSVGVVVGVGALPGVRAGTRSS
jgi:hypothetical protein